MSEAGDRAGIRRALAAHPSHDIPPVGDPYVLGRWHKDRVSPKVYVKEVLAAPGILMAREMPSRLVVFGRPCSGTTLLGQLLGQVPDIHDDRESLHHAVLSPLRFLENRARRCRKNGYVSKLLSYQVFEVQRIHDPLAFFKCLTGAGFLLLHLRRRTYEQALSLSTAQATHEYVLDTGSSSAEQPRSLRIDVDRFVDQVRWNGQMLSYEDALMRNFSPTVSCNTKMTSAITRRSNGPSTPSVLISTWRRRRCGRPCVGRAAKPGSFGLRTRTNYVPPWM